MNTIDFVRRAGAATFAALLGTALLAGCGGDEDDSADDESTAETETETESEAEPYGDEATDADVLMLAETSLGDILADASGRTLYLFTQDEGGTPTCYEECAENWPPLQSEVEDPAVGDGVDAELVGTVERDDGSLQLSYNGHPLYYFAEDSEAGDVNGQGLNELWYVLNAEGDAITS